MYSSTFFVAILALVRIANATPPACLIASLGEQTNPSDLTSLCGTLEPQVAGNITEKCSGDAESSAISIFSATCLASASVTITITSSASSSASNTGSVSATIPGSGSAKATATGSGSKTTGTAASAGTGTGTGTSSTATSPATTKSSGSSFTSPQSAFIVAPLLLAAGFVQYII